MGLKKTTLAFLMVLAFSLNGEPGIQAVNRTDEYCLQIGRYREEQKAAELVQAMKKLGHQSSYEKVMVPDKGERFRVYLGRYSTRKAAMEAGTKLFRNRSIEHFIIREMAFTKSAAPSPAEEAVRNEGDGDRRAAAAVPAPAPEKNAQTEEKKAGAGPPPISSLPVANGTSHPNGESAGTAPKIPEDPALKSAFASFQSGEYGTALGLFNKALEQPGMDGEKKEFALRRIADCYYLLGDRGSNRDLLTAIDRYKEILQRYPDAQEGNAEALYRLAKSYVKLNFFYEARREFDNLCAKYPESPYLAEALFTAGELSYRIKRFSDALERLKAYVAKFPGGEYAKDAYFGIADSHSQLQQMDLAEQWYKEALKRWPDWESIPRQSLLNLGFHYFRNKKYADAADLFFVQINLYPDDENAKDVLYLLARSLVEIRQVPLALKMFSRLIEQFPDSQQAWESTAIMANLGVQQPGIKMPVFMAGALNYRDPIGTYNLMLRKFPYGELTEGLLFQRGYALWKAGRFREAFQTYLHLANQFSKGRYRAEGMANLALNAELVVREAYGAGDYLMVADVYFKTFERGLVASRDFKVRLDIGDSLKRIGLHDEALKVFEVLLKEAGPGDRSGILLGIADCRLRQGQDDPAEKILQEITGSSGVEAATTAAARKLLADLHYRKGLFDKAASFYAEALAAGVPFDDRAALHRNYGSALKEMKSYAAARTQYQNALESYNKDPQRSTPDVLIDAYAGIGDCLFKEGKVQEAIPNYGQAAAGIPGVGENLWAFFGTARSYAKLENLPQAEQALSSLREKGGEGFWAQAGDYAVREEGWLSKYGKYFGRI